jgi:hypothetical protein
MIFFGATFLISMILLYYSNLDQVIVSLAAFVVMGADVFALYHYYRCPHCNAFLGRQSRPRYCSDCGREIEYKK